MTAPVVLCILDGWGISDCETGNAPLLAKTPTMDRLQENYPHSTLVTFGPDAGLPTGQMGNSEVGHTNIGAGRVVAMDLGQIDLAIEDGTFFDKEAILDFAAKLQKTGGTAHLIGLASDGGAHAHLDHIIAAAKAVHDRGVRVVIHAMTDGRDVAPTSAKRYLADLAKQLPEGVEIVSISGRYYAMDRDNRWERVAKAYGTMVQGDGENFADPQAGLDASYAKGEHDEFVVPFTIGDYAGMKDGDGVFFVNFRADRAREILAAMGDPEFTGFDTGKRPDFAMLLGMVEYSDSHNTYMQTVFPKRSIPNTLGEWVSKQGRRQFRLAETEKYPHVTFFLNGGVETPYPGEDRAMPASPKVATYDLQPEMSAPEVTEKFVEAIEAGYDLIVVNYANPDMVGHSGDLEAAMKACEAVDTGLGVAVEALEKVGGSMVVIADHGNCDVMIDPETGGPHTAHTINLAPLILVGGPKDVKLRPGKLADVAPTILDLMGLEKPEDMTGETLLV
ncbi:MAG: 2,3-bisphosphoglycerate-independent phosphoglycerate mutase [Planktomarina sp.]